MAKLSDWRVQEPKKAMRMGIMHGDVFPDWHGKPKLKTHNIEMQYATIATDVNPPNTARVKHWRVWSAHEGLIV